MEIMMSMESAKIIVIHAHEIQDHYTMDLYYGSLYVVKCFIRLGPASLVREENAPIISSIRKC